MIKHLAVVMDGNRRWARKNKMEALFGHSKGGVAAAKKTIAFCLENGIKYLSLYTFSLENFKRSDIEKQFLFNLLNDVCADEAIDLITQGIKVRFIGDWSLFPESVAVNCAQLEKQTVAGTTLNLNILFCYGARQEIIAAIKVLFDQVKSGEIDQKELTLKNFEACLWTAQMPEPELIIRTGGGQRLSNFLLYQAAYSEFCFLDCLWPEITKEHLAKALDDFNQTQRNFGI
jgi:undecaprenyl diphosphate synthase